MADICVGVYETDGKIRPVFLMSFRGLGYVMFAEIDDTLYN